MTDNEPTLGGAELDNAVDEMLKLGRERGEQLRQDSGHEPPASPDISILARVDLEQALLAEISELSDDELLERAWQQLDHSGYTSALRASTTYLLVELSQALHRPEAATEARQALRRFLFALQAR